MDLQQVMATLKQEMGDKFNKEKIEGVLKNVDLSKFSVSDVVAKVKASVKDLDGDGKEEGFIEEVKGKIGNMFGH